MINIWGDPSFLRKRTFWAFFLKEGNLIWILSRSLLFYRNNLSTGTNLFVSNVILGDSGNLCFNKLLLFYVNPYV
jgi:hypothetical protein